MSLFRVINMKKNIVFLLIAIQIVIISFIVNSIYQKNNAKKVVLTPKYQYAVVATYSGFLKYFYEPKPGVQELNLSWLGRKYDYKIKHTINSDTLNQVDDIPVEKPKNTKRIIAIGASFTFGGNVNTKDSYPSKLQEILNKTCKGDTKYQVINLGVFGYDIQFSVERFRVRGVKYDPDIVLWYLTADNFENMKEWKAERIIRKMTWEEKSNLQTWHLADLNNYFKKDLVFFSMPTLGWQYSRLLVTVKNNHPRTYVYRNSPDVVASGNVFPDQHPTEKGYYVIAEDIFKYLKDSKIVQCR